MNKTIKILRKIFFFVTGITILVTGILMLVLPGPGLLVMFLGLAVLTLEFVWARVLLAKIKSKVKNMKNKK